MKTNTNPFHNAEDEEGEEIKLIPRQDDGTLKLAKKYTKAIMYMLCSFLVICLIGFIPLLLSLRGTMTLLFQPSIDVYRTYIDNPDALSSCSLSVQPFVHPPDGRNNIVLLGVGSLVDLTNALQESIRVRIIDATCTTSYYEIPSCMQISWFKHGLMVKMNRVEQLTGRFPGFYPERIIIVKKNPFVEYAEEVRDNPMISSSFDEYERFFKAWVEEQSLYQGLKIANILYVTSNHTSLQTILDIRAFAPEGIVTERVTSVCYDTKYTKSLKELRTNVLTISQRDQLCAQVEEYWLKEWGTCEFGL